MFAGEMFSIYNFMLDVPEDFEFAQAFELILKFSNLFRLVLLLQVYCWCCIYHVKTIWFKQVGGLIIGGGIILLAGMIACYSL